MNRLIALLAASKPQDTPDYTYQLVVRGDVYPGTSTIRWFRAEIVERKRIK